MGGEAESVAKLALVMPEHGCASQAGTPKSFGRRVVGCGILVNDVRSLSAPGVCDMSYGKVLWGAGDGEAVG